MAGTAGPDALGEWPGAAKIQTAKHNRKARKALFSAVVAADGTRQCRRADIPEAQARLVGQPAAPNAF